MTTWEEYKAISIQTANSEMRFFKLERGIANISASQFLIASLYRAIGLNETSETEASLYAERLFISIQNTTKLGKVFDNSQLRKLIKGSLNFPKGSTKDQKQFLISPMISEIASFGGTMRQSKSWNSGGFIIDIISNAIETNEEFEELISALFSALEISDDDKDNIWSLVLKSEFNNISEKLGINSAQKKINISSLKKSYRTKNIKKALSSSNFSRTIIKDLRYLIEIEKKGQISRQQWISLLETYFRLTMFNHIIITLNLSRSYYNVLLNILDNGHKLMDEDSFNQFINIKPINNTTTNIFLTNETSREFINSNIQFYCLYNHFLHHLFKEFNIDISSFNEKSEIINSTNTLLNNIKDSDELLKLFSKYRRENEKVIKEIKIPSTSLSPMWECLTYLGQKKLKTNDLKSYVPDVNFLFAARKGLKGQPYMFELGAGVISLLTGLIFKKNEGQHFLSGLEYIKELKSYNMNLTIQDISEGQIKEVMESLGIIIDSPDTEGGVLIVKPGWV